MTKKPFRRSSVGYRTGLLFEQYKALNNKVIKKLSVLAKYSLHKCATNEVFL